MTYDAVVVGGGIVGCACAHYLSLDGRRVLVVEPGPIGGGTTAAGMGHVVAMDDSPAQLALTRYSQVLWQELTPELDPDCEMDPCGTLWVAADDEEASFLPEKQQTYAAVGVETEILDAQGVAKAEPNLREGMTAGLRVPADSVVYPMTAARWLLARTLDRGGEVRRERAARIEGRSVHLADGTKIDTDLIVNAAGCQAGDLTPGVRIEPRKGHLVITDRHPGFVTHQIVELGYLKSAHGSSADSVAFNVQPRATGQILIGSSRQYAGWDASIDRSIVARMMRRALEYMPALAGLSTIRTWTGFRPATPNKLPLIGAWPDAPGLYLAAGHEGLGITTSLGTGKMIADLAAGRTPAIDPTPFRPQGVAHV
ncbi:MAG: NAD(P)/FAD-dependent oxidoreductase [Fimbriimonas sp.]